MAHKPKPCSIGKRHKWTHVKNKVRRYGSDTYQTVSLQGIYACECGERKWGEYVYQEPAK